MTITSLSGPVVRGSWFVKGAAHQPLPEEEKMFDSLVKKVHAVVDNAKVIAAIGTAAVGLTACSPKQPDTKSTAHAAPTPSLTNASLPAAPKITADPKIIAVLKDPKIPAEVRSALLNPDVQSTLHWIATSSASPVTYVRNADYANPECVKVLQHLLNAGREAAITNALNYAAGREKAAQSPPPNDPYHGHRAEAYREEAKWLKSYALHAPPQLKTDGDYGRASHTLRGFITQVANTTSARQFQHVKVDVGANDTAIGPKTLNLLFRSSPGIAYALMSDPTVYSVSVGEYGRAAQSDPGHTPHAGRSNNTAAPAKRAQR